MAVEYAGTTYELEIGDAKFENFKQIQGIDNLEFDTDEDSLNRLFINGTKIDVQTKFSVSMSGRVTDLGIENLKNLLGDYFYEANQALDTSDQVKVGTNGALKLGLRRNITVPGSIRLRPTVAAQAKKCLNFVNPSIDLGEPELDDNLLSVGFKIKCQELVLGEVVKKA